MRREKPRLDYETPGGAPKHRRGVARRRAFWTLVVLMPALPAAAWTDNEPLIAILALEAVVAFLAVIVIEFLRVNDDETFGG